MITVRGRSIMLQRSKQTRPSSVASTANVIIVEQSVHVLGSDTQVVNTRSSAHLSVLLLRYFLPTVPILSAFHNQFAL